MPFDCVVIAREVWDTRDLVSDVLDERGKIRQGALATRFEPEDLNALEMALQIKDKHGGKVTALSLGEVRGVDVLRECLYRGVDQVIRLNGVALDTLDTQAEAELYARALRKLERYDLVLTGVTLLDGSSSLLAAHVAGLLGHEQITWVDGVEEIAPGHVVGRRAIEMGYESIEAELPAVLAVGVALLEEDPRSPRSAKATLKLKHKKTEITAWSAASLGLPEPMRERTTRAVGMAAIAQRSIESKYVDPGSEPALAAMLAEILAGPGG